MGAAGPTRRRRGGADADPPGAGQLKEVRAPGWGPGIAFAGWLAAVLAGGLAAGLALSASGEERSADAPLWVAGVGQMALWGVMVAVALLASTRFGTGRPAEDLGWRIRPADVALGVAVGLACQLVSTLGYALADAAGLVDLDDVERPAQELVDRAEASTGGVVLLVLLTAVGAPLVEELFYRGLLLRGLLRVARPALAAGVSALLFAAAHVQALQFPALAGFGLVLAVLTLRSGRLGPALAAHVAFNATALVFLLA